MSANARRFFVIEAGSSALIGIDPKTTISIRLGEGVKYSASVERIHKAMASWHAKQNPSGKTRRGRLLTHKLDRGQVLPSASKE